MIASSALVLLPLLAQPSTFAAETTYESPIRAVLEGESRADVALWDLDRWREPLEALYARQSHAPLWFVDERLTPAGRTLVRQLQDVERRGLLVTDYDGPKLAELTAGLDFRPNATAAAIARLDVALSVNVARLASDLHQGRVDPEEVGYDLDVRRPAFDAVQVVTTLATAPDVIAALDALEPQFRHTRCSK